MKVVSWTLEGIAEHTEAVLAWLEAHEPVVVCLRGIDVADADFPLLPLWELGYYTKLFGAPGAPGLAILSVEPPRDVHRGLRDGARGHGMSGRVAGVRIVNVSPAAEDAEIRAYLDARVAPHEPLLVVGVSDGSALGLEELTADAPADHRSFANAQLAAKCTQARVVDAPGAGHAVTLTFEGLPPPRIPDLDISR